MSNGAGTPPPLRWLISCDESGTHGAQFYGFGSLWMKWQRRGDFARYFADLKKKHGYDGECKWQRCNNKRHTAFFIELVDYFFRRRWLAFHCIVIRKGMVDKSLHEGDLDLARRKHFTMFLARKIETCMRAHPGREHTFRIWVADAVLQADVGADWEAWPAGKSLILAANPVAEGSYAMDMMEDAAGNLVLVNPHAGWYRLDSTAAGADKTFNVVMEESR